MFGMGKYNSENSVGAIEDNEKDSLRRSTRNKKASLTDVEMAFLSAILFDKSTDYNLNNGKGCIPAVDDHDSYNDTTTPTAVSSSAQVIEKVEGTEKEKVTRLLNDDMLFSVPACGIDSPDVIRARLLGLWRTHQADIFQIDNKICHDSEDKDSVTASSSLWSEEDLSNNWEELLEENATDVGFNCSQQKYHKDKGAGDHRTEAFFKILGANVDEKKTMPHVLSPPLMESLLNFVPHTLANSNFWMKYSLVRDGASLDTLKRYVRAAENTILAIETTKGQVFGSFTSSAWREHRGFYGSGPSFLWRMRHNRFSPDYSLLHQAQMESEIDVFTYTGLNDLLQVCNENKIAIGGGKIVPDDAAKERITASDNFDLFYGSSDDHHLGFGICINEDLSSGTSSPCGTFRNPCLSQHSQEGQIFDIANLEVWTFTACFDVNSAEQLEMTKFFMSKSLREGSLFRSSSLQLQQSSSSMICSQDLSQKGFYRRVGQCEGNDRFR